MATTSARSWMTPKGTGRVFRHTWEVLRALDEGSLNLHSLITLRRPRDRRPPGRHVRDHGRSPALRRGTARRLHPALRPHHRAGEEEGNGCDRRATQRPLSQVRRCRFTRRDQERLLPLRGAERSDRVDRRRQDPEGQEGAARRVRGTRRQGREPVPPRHHHRRRAPSAGSSHLDRRHRRSPEGDGAGVQGAAVQPDRHDGRLGCPRQHDPDASDRRHAWPRGQPSWRHDPASDQEELP